VDDAGARDRLRRKLIDVGVDGEALRLPAPTAAVPLAARRAAGPHADRCARRRTCRGRAPRCRPGERRLAPGCCPAAPRAE
jgi:hypothetical protein